LIAGIDYSITSPSICVYKDGQFNPTNCIFNCFVLVNKWWSRWSNIANVNCHSIPKNCKDVDRYAFLAQWTINNLMWHNGRVEKVYIEDYSYGSVGRVFNIAENTGILKHLLTEQHFKYECIAPTTIKKFATQKGNSNKEAMLEAWKNEPGTFELAQEKGNPSSDIVDSYFICKYGFMQSQ
jgi:Holliday junction resolvasome RuvABC endonuclease subunit